MSKKMMLLALAAVSAAIFALPAAASANSNHLNKTSAFTVHGSAGNLNTVGGRTVSCATTTGTGSFTSTTVGTVHLVFHACATVVLGFKVNCTTAGQPTGTIITTTLGIDLVRIDNNKGPGVLVTPPSKTEEFAHFDCFGQAQTVTGNGIVGAFTLPDCDDSSNTATVDFNSLEHGVQEHRTVTGVAYSLFSFGEQAALNTHATITFAEGTERTLECTV